MQEVPQRESKQFSRRNVEREVVSCERQECTRKTLYGSVAFMCPK